MDDEITATDCTGAEAGDVYIPKVFRQALSPRVLVTEWIESNRLHERDVVAAKFDVPAVLESVVRSYADLIFVHGFIHADPHPANVLVREHPAHVRKPGAAPTSTRPPHQVVYIDWGLATKESVKFRHEYAQIFKAVFTRDDKTITDIIGSWGISDPGLFASMMLQKPISLDKRAAPVHQSKVSKEHVLQMQRQMKEKATSLLQDETKVPKELILLGRGMNLIRGINKSFGAPVNRVNILAERAARSLGGDLGGPIAQFRFRASLAWLSLMFRVLQWYAAAYRMFCVVFGGRVPHDAVTNLEDMLEEQENRVIDATMRQHHPPLAVHEDD